LEIIDNLTENEILYKFIDNPWEGVFFIDENKIIRYINHSVVRYNRIPREDIIGHSIYHKFKNLILDVENIERVLEKKRYEPLTYIKIGEISFIGSKTPVYRDNVFVGVFCRYISIDAKDVGRILDQTWIDILAGVQVKDIMSTVYQTLLELNSYKDEFKKQHTAQVSVQNIIGDTPIMVALKKKILMISDSPSTVLITGESGTGKELFAQAIHYHGERSPHPFVKVNCAAIPENLLESELFGYEEGAFTGARKTGKMGKFELANKGTIFLDEIGDMPLLMQTKLLRVLQEKEINRLGSEKTVTVDVRVVTATNKNLYSLVKAGLFREDLYYRINVVQIHVPPLRERKPDILKIADYLIRELNKDLKLSILGITEEAKKLLVYYSWPGNIRELRNVLESAMNFCSGSMIDMGTFQYLYRTEGIQTTTDKVVLKEEIGKAEKNKLISILAQCGGRRKQAATMMNISKSTLYRLMKKHDLL